MPYELPPLPYDYNALEPTSTSRRCSIHHDKHHQAYVDNLNKALEGTELGRASPIEELLAAARRAAGGQSARRCATTAAATPTTRCSGRS